jgi:hypothetical protein
MSDELMLQVAALKVISEFTKRKYDEARKEAAAVMRRGDRRQVYSPLDGTKIGPVSMSDPKVSSVITDEQALTQWMQERYPESIERGYKVVASEAELVSVLIVHAPNLLKRVKRVKRDALMRIHADTVAVGQPIGPSGEADMPGVTLEEQEAVVSCRPDPDSALLAVMELIQNRRLLLDGTIPVLEQGQ